MWANTSFFDAIWAKTGAWPVVRMPARPAPACNRPRRDTAVAFFLIVMRFLRVELSSCRVVVGGRANTSVARAYIMARAELGVSLLKNVKGLETGSRVEI